MADVLNETLQDLAKNDTAKPKATTEGMMVAYTSLVLMACLPIFFGAFRSISCLQKQKVYIRILLNHMFMKIISS